MEFEVFAVQAAMAMAQGDLDWYKVAMESSGEIRSSVEWFNVDKDVESLMGLALQSIKFDLEPGQTPALEVWLRDGKWVANTSVETPVPGDPDATDVDYLQEVILTL